MKVIDLDEIMSDQKLFYSKLHSYIDNTLKHYEKRHNKISFKLNGVLFENVSIANFVTQMILLIPFVDLNVKFKNELMLLDNIKNFNISMLTIYFNEIIAYFGEELNDDNYINELNNSLKKIINIFSDISGKCNIYSGTTINLRDIFYLYKNNKEFQKKFNLKVPNKLDFSEIQGYIDKQFKFLMDTLSNSDNCFKPYFLSNAGINKKQFKEVIAKIGLKADLEGNIIPYVINTNYLLGLNSMTDYFITSKLARKASITSHTEVKNSGYLNRKISLLLIDTLLSDIDDCHTDEYVEINIDCTQTAKRYNGRYYLDEKTNEIKLFQSKNAKEFIGKTLQFRSPIKCKCKDGNICHKCYGDLYKVNKDIHIGILADLLLCEQLTQTLLSAKHLQQVNSDVLNWPDKFLEYFIIDKGNILCDTSKEKSGIFIILAEDDYEIDEDNNTKIQINSFTIKYKNGKEEKIVLPITLNTANSTSDILTNPFKDMNNRIVISFKSLCENNDEPVFTFIQENNELSSSLKELINLIEKSDHLGVSTIEELTNLFIKLLNDGDITLDAIHAELIIRNMIRKACNITERPERFDRQDDPTDENYYTILRVSSAISNSPSSAVSLSFEKLKQQIQNPMLYRKKGKSILDEIYFS